MYNTYKYNQRKYNWLTVVIRRIIKITANFIKGNINALFIYGKSTVNFVKGKVEALFKGNK